MINNYGAAGSNAAALLCQGPFLNSQMVRSTMPQNQEYPIFLSAASRNSLLMDIATLEKYLKEMDSRIAIGDLAFTLSEKRAHLQYRWAASVSDINTLQQSLKAIENPIEAPQQPKKVVLVFSGQSTQNSGSEQSLYESCPLIKHYIDHCNHILKELDFPSIVPVVFNTEPSTDIVSHQCGIFAFQYAVAKTWIDCGVRIDAVVGQSFGELTALAVSGVLSLKDGLKLIGTRARLMQTKWGPDRGTMLAIHSSIEVVQDLIDSTPSGCQQIEIACYNAPTFQVVVGTDESIAAVEETLKSCPRFNSIRHQRLEISHGFHSRFTETIVEDLRTVANTMTFNLPKLPIETGTLQQLEVFTPDHIPRHTRNPVYFYHAIRRIEQRLGPCIWLEAGINSPIIPLVKKAVESPTQHVFESLRPKDPTRPMSALCSVTLDLWREGIAATYWNFKTPQQTGVSQIWIPPYQFEKTPHWMPYKDPIIEVLRSQRLGDSLPTDSDHVSEESRLVSFLESSSKFEDQFSVNTSTERFVKIVSGHTVLGQPVCPASLYMECAVKAVQLSFGSIENQALWFEDLTFDTPLGVDPQRKCSLTLKREENQLAWAFFIRSMDGKDSESRSTLHARGKVGFTRLPQFHRYHRLVQSRMEDVEKKQHTECLRGQRAYKLFSRVVQYAPFMRSLSSVTLGEDEATARIEVPNAHLKDSESPATSVCDAISLDAFIQALGLLTNSSDHCGGDEAFLATGIESFSMSLNCDFSRCRSWNVYTMFSLIDGVKARGDIYIFHSDGTMALSIMDAQFTKIPNRTLERILVTANQQTYPKGSTENFSKADGTHSSSGSQSPQGNGTSSAFDTGYQSSISADYPSLSGDDKFNSKLEILIASYAGVSEDKLVGEASLAELGVDTLAAFELAQDIASKFSVEIEGGRLISMTLSELCETVAPANKPEAPKETSEVPNVPKSLTQTAVAQERDLNQPISSSMSLPSHYTLRKTCKIQTIAYKVVGELEILSDIYYPNQRQPEPLPIALLLHGGGFMTLSKKAVRPHQIQFLLDNRILPVSLDYRLCPETNLIDGSITDVRDALFWAQQELPSITSSQGYVIDPDRIVMIGWSTGGYLAMSTAWSSLEAGQTPPRAILSFYSPTDITAQDHGEQGGVRHAEGRRERQKSRDRLRMSLPSKPMASYDNEQVEGMTGWVRPNDPRSAFILRQFVEGHGVQDMLHGLYDDWEKPPAQEKVTVASPMAWVTNGKYTTPTYLIHGDEDEVIPYNETVAFFDALQASGVQSELLTVPGAKHLFDLQSKPGSRRWKDGVGPGYEFLLRKLNVK